ncbi:MAG TPA: Yip1 family protein [Usitatibacter sp.]|nr:Yip1 family protein [Usitatibacter sp.]
MALIDRVKNMMMTPKTEWDVVAAEPTQPADLVKGYVLPLAAVAAVAGFIGAVVVGTNVPMMGTVRVSVVGGLIGAIMQLVMAVVMVFVMGFIIDALAPTFGAQKSMAQAVKVAAYSYTPVWVLSIVAILPYIGLLVALVAAVYAIYLLYLGLPRVMKVPQDKAVGYTVLVVVVGIVVGFIVALVVGLVTAPFMGAGAMMSSGSGVTYDKGSPMAKMDEFTRKMEEANRKMEAAQKSGDPNKQMEAALGALGTAMSGGKGVEPVQLDALKPLLPEKFAGLPRKSQRADRSGVAGLMAAKVEGEYADDGGKRVELEITDTGGAAGLMGLAAWAGMGASSESEDDQRIERMRRDGNRLHREEVSKRGGTNTYSVILADRFVVQAEGQGVDINALKSAVGSLDLGKLESLK